MRTLPLLLLAACAGDPLPLCSGDPAAVVGWSVAGGMLDTSDLVLAPRGHAWWELDADCRFLAYDRADEAAGGVWSPWRTGTLDLAEAEGLRDRLDLDRWPRLTDAGVTAGQPFPDAATTTFRAGASTASCVNCTDDAIDLGAEAQAVLADLLDRADPIVPTTARVATFAEGAGFTDDERALHVPWEASTPASAWAHDPIDAPEGFEAPPADLEWLVDVWVQQVLQGDPRFLLAADVGDGETVGLAVRPLP